MKRKEIVKMIDDTMKEVDILMDERDYDSSACKLSDLIWVIRKELVQKIIKEAK